MRLLITTLNFKIIRKLFRFLWRLLKLCVVLALGLNSLTFIVLSYRKADDAFVEECSRTVVTRFPTVLHVRDGQAGDVEGREGDAEPLSREIPAGTEVKVLAVYAEGFSGRVKPHWYNVHQDWYVELEDGSRGHAVLPEACIGTVCEDPEGNRMEIRDVRRRNAENGEVRYVLYTEGSSQAWEVEDLYFPVPRTSRAYAYPVYTDNPGIKGLSLSLGRGFYSYPFIMDLFVLPYWLRLALGVLGVVPDGYEDGGAVGAGAVGNGSCASCCYSPFISRNAQRFVNGG